MTFHKAAFNNNGLTSLRTRDGYVHTYVRMDFAVHSGLYQNHPFTAGVCKCSIDNFSFHLPLHAKDSEVEISNESQMKVE